MSVTRGAVYTEHFMAAEEGRIFLNASMAAIFDIINCLYHLADYYFSFECDMVLTGCE